MSAATVAALAVLAAVVAPDLLLPGERAVRHELVLEDGPLLARYCFVASPTQGFGGVARVEPGQPFAFSSKYGTKIWALPAGLPVPEEAPGHAEAGTGWPAAAIAGSIPVAEVRSVPVASPVHRIVTTLRVEAVGADGVLLRVVAHRCEDRHGRAIARGFELLLLAVALVGLAGVLRLAKQRAAEGREVRP